MTNAGITIALQGLGGSEFLGHWAITSIPMFAGIGVQRAVLTQSVLRGARVRDVPRLGFYLRLLSAVVVVSTVVLVVLFDADGVFTVIALGAPIVLVQDMFRLRAFGAGRPASSAGSDLIWLGVTALSILVASSFCSPQTTAAVGVVAYMLGAAAGLSLASTRWPTASPESFPHPRTAFLVAESTAVFGLGNVALIVVSSTNSVEIAGQFRLALALIQPLAFAVGFCTNFLVPRIPRNDTRSTIVLATYAAGLCLAVGASCIAAVVADPWGWADRVIGDGRHALIQTICVLVVAQTLGMATSLMMVRIRTDVLPRHWLTARFMGASSDPLIAVPTGVVLGPVGIALGTLANNVAVAAFVMVRTMSSRTAGGARARAGGRVG